VLDFGRPEDAERAASSARESGPDVRVLIVENAAAAGSARDEAGVPRLRLRDNLGFAGGMNAGLRQLLDEGCDRLLLLNNDAVLEPGCLSLLVAALEDPAVGAVGPLILSAEDGRVESRGLRVDLRHGRVRLEGAGTATDEGAPAPVDALSGAVLMTTATALDRVGLLDAEFFFSFEDVDWCVRARRAGLELLVVTAARARHAGSRTIGRDSPDRLYFAARNHLRCAEKLLPLAGLAHWRRRAAILARNLAFALRQRDVARGPACRAVLDGYADARAGRLGPRRL
jgi:GT2 family glycosyltransferase